MVTPSDPQDVNAASAKPAYRGRAWGVAFAVLVAAMVVYGILVARAITTSHKATLEKPPAAEEPAPARQP